VIVTLIDNQSLFPPKHFLLHLRPGLLRLPFCASARCHCSAYYPSQVSCGHHEADLSSLIRIGHDHVSSTRYRDAVSATAVYVLVTGHHISAYHATWNHICRLFPYPNSRTIWSLLVTPYPSALFKLSIATRTTPK
jgi:hypothetical protein